MGVIDTVKDVAFLVQKTDNVDLLRRVIELLQQVQALADENRALQEQVRGLNDKLATREQMTFRSNAYWKGDDGPFCPRCFDAESLVLRMLIAGKGHDAKCPKCATVASDPNRPPRSPIRVRSGYLDRDRNRF